MTDYPKVLYIEDDGLSRMVMDILLHERMGLQNVVIWEDSHNFAAQIDQLPFVPDIILLDIHVEPLNGYEMLSILRHNAAFQTKRIVALTASVMNEEVDQLRTAGFDSIFAKPINEDVFPDQLNRLLDGEQIWNIS